MFLATVTCGLQGRPDLPHGHGANERLDTRGGLIVAGPEASADILVVQHLDLEDHKSMIL